jgi:hypothetical protein
MNDAPIQFQVAIYQDTEVDSTYRPAIDIDNVDEEFVDDLCEAMLAYLVETFDFNEGVAIVLDSDQYRQKFKLRLTFDSYPSEEAAAVQGDRLSAYIHTELNAPTAN